MGWDEEAQPLTVWIKMMPPLFTFAHFSLGRCGNTKLLALFLFYTHARSVMRITPFAELE